MWRSVPQRDSLEYIDKYLEHESKLMKLSEAQNVTVEQLLPPHQDGAALMIALFGAVDHVVVPCQKE